MVRGMKTNAAWNHGLSQVRTRYAVVANDDIEVFPEDWLHRLVRHLSSGVPWVTALLGRERRRRGMEGIGERGAMAELRHPPNKGHLVGMDMARGVAAIPDDMEIYYGDDWFYFQMYQRFGVASTAMDVAVETGSDVQSLRSTEPDGWTTWHPRIEEFLGEAVADVAQRDHANAGRYFARNEVSPLDFPEDSLPRRMGWRGAPLALHTEVIWRIQEAVRAWEPARLQPS